MSRVQEDETLSATVIKLVRAIAELLLQLCRGLQYVVTRVQAAVQSREERVAKVAVEDEQRVERPGPEVMRAEAADNRRRRYYAVAEGRRPGIYESWIEAGEQVNGFPGNRHQAFRTKEEAAHYLSPHARMMRALNRP